MRVQLCAVALLVGALSGCQGCGPPGLCASGLFEQCLPWTEDVSGLTKAADSDAIIAALDSAGGWGSAEFRTERSLLVLRAPAGTPYRAFTPTADFYNPDCDQVPFPVPAVGAIEGEADYACVGGGDCHLLVIDGAQKKLYEMNKANITGPTQAEFFGGCAVVWDLTKAYGDTLRGKGCSSADGAGFPMAAMLATADEVYAGEVAHALRFTLPNDRIRDGLYVPPATHSTFPTSGGANLPPYGARLRLKANVDLTGLGLGATTLANALKKYGMFLSDGGNIPLTIGSDRFTTHSWSELGITDDLSLASLTVTDFEVVDLGTPVDWKADTDCIRNP